MKKIIRRFIKEYWHEIVLIIFIIVIIIYNRTFIQTCIETEEKYNEIINRYNEIYFEISGIGNIKYIDLINNTETYINITSLSSYR